MQIVRDVQPDRSVSALVSLTCRGRCWTRPSTRIDLAVGAVNDSMAELPDDARGSVGFSSVGQAGSDYQPPDPFAALGRPPARTVTANALRQAALGMPKLVRGDTGLYDTIWAAYQAAQADRPQIENLVMVITDGEMTTTGGLSGTQLIAKLRAAVARTSGSGSC